MDKLADLIRLINEAEKKMDAFLKIVGKPGECRSCKAAIFWVTTKTGKSMPVDPDGISHFATCPHAASHRRKP